MDTTELAELFREDVHDTADPGLWTANEIILYMDAAQKQFCRLAGGIADSQTPAICTLTTIVGNPWIVTDPRILKFRRAWLTTDATEIKIINHENLDTVFDTSDYGFDRPIRLDMQAGPVRYLITNMHANQVRTVRVPAAVLTIQLAVYRLPLVTINDYDLPLEIDQQHHHYLLLWMKALAYAKQDAETRNDKLREQNAAEFRAYCDQARREREAREHKPRVVTYGGL